MGFKPDLHDGLAECRLQRTADARAAGVGSERIRLQLKMVSRVHGCSAPLTRINYVIEASSGSRRSCVLCDHKLRECCPGEALARKRGSNRTCARGAAGKSINKK